MTVGHLFPAPASGATASATTTTTTGRTIMLREDAIARIQSELVELCREVGGVRGVLAATTDGHPITHNLPTASNEEDSSLSTAAMIAALLGIGQRLSQLTGDPTLLDAVVRSPGGSVVIYAAGPGAVVTVLTDATVNLARLNLAARIRLPRVEGLVEALAPRTTVG